MQTYDPSEQLQVPPVGAPAWETSKENVLPIKRGRSARGLSASLSQNPVLVAQQLQSQPLALSRQEQEFEADLQSIVQNAGCDSVEELKLEAYIKYLKWIRDTFPSNTEKKLETFRGTIYIFLKLLIFPPPKRAYKRSTIKSSSFFFGMFLV